MCQLSPSLADHRTLVDTTKPGANLSGCEHEDIVHLVHDTVSDETPPEFENWKAQPGIAHLVNVEVMVLIEDDVMARRRVQRLELREPHRVVGKARPRPGKQLLTLLSYPLETRIRALGIVQSDQPMQGVQRDCQVFAPGRLGKLQNGIDPPAVLIKVGA